MRDAIIRRTRAGRCVRVLAVACGLAAIFWATSAGAFMLAGRFVQPHAPRDPRNTLDMQIHDHQFHVIEDATSIPPVVAVYNVPAELQPEGPFIFMRTASGRVLYSYRNVPPDQPGDCSGGTLVYFHRFPASGQDLIPIRNFCIPRGKAWERFYDAPASSEQQIAVLAENSDGARQNVYWVDLVTGDKGDTEFEPEFDAQVGITFAPSGNAALVRYDTDDANDGIGGADYRLVDLCPGRVGRGLHDWRDLGGFAFATVGAQNPDGSYRTKLSDVSHPDVEIDAFPLADCLGTPPPTPTTFSLSIAMTGTGSGYVFSAPGSIYCGPGAPDCQDDFAPGTEVTLYAFPDYGSALDHWSGDCAGATDTTVVQLDSDRRCTAHFVQAAADLRVSATASPDPAVAGGTLTYRIAVTNAGPTNATLVNASVSLPPGARFESSGSTPGCQSSPGGAFCQVGDVPSGATSSLNVVVRVDPAARGSLSTTVSVGGAELDPDPANDSTTVVSSLTALVALSINVSDLPDPAAAGGVLTYRITFANAGPSSATGILMRPTLPAGVRLLQGSGTSLTCGAASLLPGESRVFTLLAGVTAPEGDTLTASADVSAIEQDTDLSDNSDSEDTLVGPASAVPMQPFTRIADQSTLVPDGAGAFTLLYLPALSDAGLSFVAEGAGQYGVYRWLEGSLQTVADRTTFIPEGGNVRFNFFDVDTVSMDGPMVAFGGNAPNQNGAYYTNVCGLQMAVTSLNQPRFGLIDYTFFNGLTLRDERLAFHTGGLAPGPIVLWQGGAVNVLASREIQLPGSSDTYAFLDRSMLDGSTVVFAGAPPVLNPSPGGFQIPFRLFAWQGGATRELVAPGSPVPEGSGNFQSIGSSPVLRDGLMAYAGRDEAGRLGVYLYDLSTGAQRKVVDAATPVPDSTETFVNLAVLDNLSLQGGRVAFVGGSNRGTPLPPPVYFRWEDQGIYLWEDGRIRPVIRAGDVLDGKVAASFSIGREALNGNRLAFRVRFEGPVTGRDEAIYLADLGSPALPTAAGTNVSVHSGPVTVTFSEVTVAGGTTITTTDPAAAGTLPGGFALGDGLPAYEIETTASYLPPVTVCIRMDSVSDPAEFAGLRILHGEAGTLVDRTILSPDAPAPDFATRTLCARVDSLSPFVVARLSNRAPEARARNVTVSAGASCSASAAVDDGSFDADGDPVTLSQSPAGPYTLGETLVTLTVTDGHGAATQATATVTVVDTTRPAVSCPAPMTVEFTDPAGARVTFSPTATDDCSGPPALSSEPASGSLFPIGTTSVTVAATDAYGNAAACSFNVTVLGPRGVLQNVLDELIALRAATTDRWDREKLSWFVARLTEALDAALWLNETHLQPRPESEQVFSRLRDVVNKLGRLIEFQGDSIPDGPLRDFRDRVVRVSRQLSLVAMTDAIAAGGNSAGITLANEELARGDNDIAAGLYESGIEHYREAWKHALKAATRR